MSSSSPSSLKFFFFFKGKWKCEFPIFLTLVLFTRLSTPTPSHVIVSDSREEPEFQIVFSGIEGYNSETSSGGKSGVSSSVKSLLDSSSSSTSKDKEKDTKEDDGLPVPGPILPPIPSFRSHRTPPGLDQNFIRELDLKTDKLRKIDELTKSGVTTDGCLGSTEFEMLPDIKISTEFANVIMEKVDMIVSFLYKLKKYEMRVKSKKEIDRDEEEVYRYALETVKEAYPIKDLRLLIFTLGSSEQSVYTLTGPFPSPPSISSSSSSSSDLFYNLTKVREKVGDLIKKPWFFDPNHEGELDRKKWMGREESLSQSYHKNRLMDQGMMGGSHWTWPYFNCSAHQKENNPNNKNTRRKEDEEEKVEEEGGEIEVEEIEEEVEIQVEPLNLVHHHQRPTKSKRATYKGHPVHVHGHFLQGRGGSNKAREAKRNLENAWFASYTSWFPIKVMGKPKKMVFQEYGQLSLDLDLSKFEINQCGFEDEGRREWDMKENPMYFFRDTHKCDRLKGTSTCHFIPGQTWSLGGYECRCAKNTYAYQQDLNNTISGEIAEAAWITMRENKTNVNSSIMYQEIVTCKSCPEGCEDCVDGVSCWATISWVFRIVILTVSVICSIGSIALVFVTYKFRKIPVLKSSSPLFHCITLFGCVIMYSEMIALFPVLSQATCVMVKWTRHFGFCITYTALYMKLCRVFLTFRVKSAHKIKLTEKHLLHWMSPIMVVMLLYLSAWTISSPPQSETIFTTDGLKFYQCIYNWWDHALAIGEIIFLAYGVWICWRIRENPDAHYISLSIYNIAFTNLVMVTFHLLILPQAGPDAKYALAFIRTQLSTTVTIALVFGSKLLAVLRGDPKAMKKLPTSANGFGHETLDLEEENQQLKEELTKMATQMEKLKSYAMCKNNPHLKHSSANITSDADYNKGDPFSSL